MVGRENVYFVVFEDNRFVLDAIEIIPEGNVITIATKSLFGLATDAMRAVLRVRKIGIDAVVDMEFLTRFSAILTFTTGAKSRVGFHTFFGDGPYRGDLMTHRLLYNPHLHTSHMFEAMVEALTRDPAVLPTFDFTPSADQPLARFRPSPSEIAEINALLQHENPGYVQLIPPLALLAASYYARLWSRTIQPPHWLLRPRVTYAWLALTVITSIIHWAGLAPRRLPSEVGRYLFTHSNPQDRIFVWGQKVNIYLEAHRRPASRYITIFPLTGDVFGGRVPGLDIRSRILPGAWSTLEQDFARHPPAYIVDVQADPKTAQDSVKDFPILAKLLAERYQPVAHTAEGVIYRMR